MRRPPLHDQIVLKPLCFGLFLVLHALFWLHVDPAEAYFESRVTHENAWLAPEQDQASTGQGSFHLGLYAVLAEQESQPKAAFVLLPTSDYRLHLDVINCNPPVIVGLARQFTSLELTVQTLLYADLKLKKLMEKYALLQEQALVLLQKNPRTAQKTEDGSTKQNLSPASTLSAAPLQNKMHLMEAQKNYESRRILQTRSEYSNPNDLQSLLSGPLASLERSAQKSSQTLDTMVKSILASQDSTAASGSAHSEHKIDALYKAKLQDRSEPSELPWVIRIMLRAFHYTLTHKIEVGAYAMIAFLFAGIILSVRRV